VKSRGGAPLFAFAVTWFPPLLALANPLESAIGLRGRAATLRPTEERDAKAIYNLYRDAATMRFFAGSSLLVSGQHRSAGLDRGSRRKREVTVSTG
jgi:hypothetical protein